MDQLLGTVILFAGNYAPYGWAICDGTLLPVNQYSALFSLLGTTYGGDGSTTFGLPDLRGRVPLGVGTGPGLSPRVWGAHDGAENNTLLINNLPAHNHGVTGGAVPVTGTLSGTMKVNNTGSGSQNPAGKYLGVDGSVAIYSNTQDGSTLASDAITIGASALSVNLNGVQTGSTGLNAPVNNMQPFLAMNYIIATTGFYPGRP